MLTNSDCTIYSRSHDTLNDCDLWQRQYVPECWWHYGQKATITKNGMESHNELTVRIPDVTVKVKKDDLVVKGNCTEKIDSIKDLSKYDAHKVAAANYNLAGSNQHIKVVGV